ncbi:MAG: sulfotransferase [Fuerstiella sp.]
MNLRRIWNRLDAVRRTQAKRWRRRLFPAPRNAAPTDAKLVFVIASPRSGTTWLQKALNEHPQITCGENRLFGSYFDVVNTQGTRQLRVTMDQYAATLAQRTKRQEFPVGVEAYAEQLTAGFARVSFDLWRRHSGKPILVDKVTPYPGTATEVVQQIRRFFPEASIIQLVRDGRDVVTSGVFHWLMKSLEGRPTSDIETQRRARFVDGRYDVHLTRFFSDEDIETWATTWCEPLSAVADPAGARSLPVRYEDLLQNQPMVLRKICQYVGADSAGSIVRQCVLASSFERMSGGRRPGQMDATAHVRRGVAGDWKNYFTRRDGVLFDQRCGDQLLSLGYEPDRSWISMLPDELSSERKAA